ncbi:ORF39 [Spodoptera eridania nucleopolyhedrovirus]|uniref:ORF39 n=1 Tax=Spodoptera eridania nucleopolyhedrovirus TaxID=2315721 RepID=A0A346TPX7_9ABAC|nr:ORF39 [Spodoptera eridania nucleopolyhedrovirus]AXU41637.1 ORF39 [Spodoptera eridania nucleopolyhedrovirus]
MGRARTVATAKSRNETICTTILMFTVSCLNVDLIFKTPLSSFIPTTKVVDE